jgi:putative flippase GtrA
MVAAGRLHDIVQLARLHETKLRFVVAGGLNTLFGLAAFPILMWLFSSSALHYLVILTLAQVLSILFAFLTNKFLVFRTRGNLGPELVKFCTFHAGYFLANLAALPLLVEVCGIPPIWAQLLFAGCVIVTSYFWHSRITFHTGVSRD